jgi:FtsH-binding integral membrane protein
MSTAIRQVRDITLASEGTDRATFVRRTYNHLAMAIFAFIGLEFAIFQTSLAEKMTAVMAGSRLSWLVVLLTFMIVSWVADKWARSDTSRAMQYLGLAVYIAAEAVIFVPLLYIAANFASPDVIPLAALLTGVLFFGLSFAAFTTGQDFSFLGAFVKVGGCVALGLIGASLVFGFTPGLIFSGAMVVLASAAILYTTSNIIHQYETDQHVAAALALFASVALLFWYILRILIRLTGR